jgi:hypothetical protein
MPFAIKIFSLKYSGNATCKVGPSCKQHLLVATYRWGGTLAGSVGQAGGAGGLTESEVNGSECVQIGGDTGG